MRKGLIGLALTLSFSVVTAANTQLNTIDSNILTNIRINLSKSLPDLTIDQVDPTPVANIYQVISGRKVFYVDNTGRYAFLGNLVDLTTKQSLTEQQVKQLSVVDWNKLPLNIALRQVIGKGEQRIAIFTDPDCPFCKRLETETIPKLNNVTVYYFLFPLSIHANAESDSKKILCSEIPDKVFLDWMKYDKILPSKTTCNNAAKLEQMKEVAKKVIQVEATPTIILPNGAIVTGLVPADYLTQLITEAAPKVAASASIKDIKK
ncbi:MAG: DsbC family protein [Burkholderiales bacterium]